MSVDIRASLVFAREAFVDGEIAIGLDALRDVLDEIPAVPEHACPVCESDCDRVTFLRRRVRELEDDLQRVAYALIQEREIRAWAASEIEARFPGEAAA